MIVAIPTEIYDQIGALVDELIAAEPAAEKDRAHLRAQLTDYVTTHNRVPTREELSLAAPPHGGEG